MVHIDDTTAKPKNPIKVANWENKDAQSKVGYSRPRTHLIFVNLRPNKIAKAMWDYLKNVYNLYSSARLFRLEYDI